MTTQHPAPGSVAIPQPTLHHVVCPGAGRTLQAQAWERFRAVEKARAPHCAVKRELSLKR